MHEIVKLDIPQKASLERQAFIADLQTTDTAGADLKNFNVAMHIADQSGSETNLQGQRYVDLFAITTPQESNYTADHSILNTQTAESKWTLVPAAGLGGTDPNGTHYNVSATYTYVINGVQQRISTAPVDITIYPMPLLKIDYYIPRDVKANHPVKLGVVVRNIGAGPANNLVIQSGQPKITQNQSGLLITFGLLGGSVKGQPQPSPSLTLNFGDLPAHSQTYGYWILATDSDGQFTGFTANYTEQTFQGVTLSPLIVAVHANIIVQGDVVPAGGQTVQVVASDINVAPDALLNLETGVSTPVTTDYVGDSVTNPPTTTYCLPATTAPGTGGAAPGTGGSAPGTGGEVLAVVPDAFPGVALTSVLAHYPDGTSTELLTASGLVWRGTDVTGPKVYVVDTPRGPTCTTYTLTYNVAVSTATPTPTSTSAPTATATATATAITSVTSTSTATPTPPPRQCRRRPTPPRPRRPRHRPARPPQRRRTPPHRHRRAPPPVRPRRRRPRRAQRRQPRRRPTPPRRRRRRPTPLRRRRRVPPRRRRQPLLLPVVPSTPLRPPAC